MSDALVEAIAKEVAAPVILHLLKPVSAGILQKAVDENVDLEDLFESEPEIIERLNSIVNTFPGSHRATDYISDSKWIDWFIENELQHNRPDLYVTGI